MFIRKRLAFVLAGTLISLLGTRVLAAPITLARVDVVFDQIGNFTSSNASTAALNKSATSSSGLSNANASAVAGAEVGHLQAYVDGNTQTFSGGLADNLGQSIVARLTSTASFSDALTVAAIGHTGDLVTITASLLFDGFLSTTAAACCSTPGASNGGAADARADVNVQLLGTGLQSDLGLGATFLAAEARARAFDPTGSPVNVSRTIPTIVPVVFTARIGSSAAIQYTMVVQGFGSSSVFRNSAATGLSSSRFVGDYSGSLRWGGITSVIDRSGNTILDYTATGEGGFNYRNAFPKPSAVPEPSSLILLLSAGLATRVRRVRSRR